MDTVNLNLPSTREASQLVRPKAKQRRLSREMCPAAHGAPAATSAAPRAAACAHNHQARDRKDIALVRKVQPSTPPTPANVTWLRTHFQRARINNDRETARTFSPDRCTTLFDSGDVFTKVAIIPRRAPSPELSYIGQLERTRSLQFLLSPASGAALRSAQQSLALCHLLLPEQPCNDDNDAQAKRRLGECLRLVVEFTRR